MSPGWIKLDAELGGLTALCKLVLQRRDDIRLQFRLAERLSAGRTPPRIPTGMGETVDFLVLCAAAAAEEVRIQCERGGGDRFLGAVATLHHELTALTCEIALLRNRASSRTARYFTWSSR